MAFLTGRRDQSSQRPLAYEFGPVWVQGESSPDWYGSSTRGSLAVRQVTHRSAEVSVEENATWIAALLHPLTSSMFFVFI